MPSTFQLWMQGAAVPEAFYDRIAWLEIEESSDLPGSLQMRLPVSASADGDLNPLNDPGLQPMANLAVVATPGDGAPECLFDGYVLAHKIHVEAGISNAHLEVYSQDSSWLMNLEDKTREWANVTDGAAANTIFGEYGMAPGPDNLGDDSPAHAEDGHTLMQRGTDLQFLQMLARRSGKLCRVVSGAAPRLLTGVFAKPSVDGAPVVTLSPNSPSAANVGALDIEWDVMRPASIVARQALFTDSAPEGATGDATASGLAPMDERDLATFAGQPMKSMLTATVDDGGALRQRAEAVLREAGWFVRVTGDADVASLHHVLRVGQVVQIDTLGSVHSGKYWVSSVRHRITAEAHRMSFVLVRNAVGPAAVAPGGLF